ncbi:hypothetical protein [Paracoccus fontiphilus]|uniref:Pentapeptide repeat-containing protein n=1 Tax=Paracoccus fontiphilus TaxID=1815556 RepID=A0ABV7IJJ6_9RHOB
MTTIYTPRLTDLSREFTIAERELLTCSKTTGELILSDSRPDLQSSSNTIRAELIRYLLLGGCSKLRPHPKQVQITGAWITGELDLILIQTSLALQLFKCNIEKPIKLFDARIFGLDLSGSMIPALYAHRLHTVGPVHLRNGFQCNGIVDLSRANIGEKLDCSKSKFLLGDKQNCRAHVFNDDAANALLDISDSNIKGCVHFNGAIMKSPFENSVYANGATIGNDFTFSRRFFSIGTVDITGATIRGQLSFSNKSTIIAANKDKKSKFNAWEKFIALRADGVQVDLDVLIRNRFTCFGSLDLSNARIGGQLCCEGCRIVGSVSFQQTRVDRTFFWRNIVGRINIFDLRSLRVLVLDDDFAHAAFNNKRSSWDIAEKSLFTNFSYSSLKILGDIRGRLKWLERGSFYSLSHAQPQSRKLRSDVKVFDGQPYTHFAQLLEASGNGRAAALARYLREEYTSAYQYSHRKATMPLDWRRSIAFVQALSLRLLDRLFCILFGYGHKPFRIIIFSGAVVLLSSFYFMETYSRGEMAPSSSVVLTSLEWQSASLAGCPIAQEFNCDMPLRLWENSTTYKDYETFSAIGYGLDLFLPILDLGQERAWSPSPGRGLFGKIGFYLRWIVQVCGWIVVIVSAAVVTGLIGRRD